MTRSALPLALALVGGSLVSSAQAQPAPAAAPAQVALPVTTVVANINITPRRLTFDHNKRTATVYLYNQGGQPATVDVTLVDRVMRPDGQIILAEDAVKTPVDKALLDRLKSAKDMVQVAPRRVMLAPGHGQMVRLRIGNVPEAPADAEYRTHLTVTTIPPRDTGVTAADAAGPTASNRLSFKVTAVYGLSIPIIIRAGAPDVHASLANAHVETEVVSVDGASPPKPTPVLVVDLVRGASSSLFGNLEVRPAGVKGAAALGGARGIGVYSEIDQRRVKVPLSRAPNPGEKLEVTFTDDDTSPGKVLAKSVL